ncbi:hypothetical protein GCM10025778_23180 [Paeniglutamicibacter antarcticus]|uniref:Uncharacterized protein n=1 Tax=Paeniglutamicibacter antarcticus TaxID=494023 RepID=A0ABP9TS27_9MICC
MRLGGRMGTHRKLHGQPKDLFSRIDEVEFFPAADYEAKYFGLRVISSDESVTKRIIEDRLSALVSKNNVGCAVAKSTHCQPRPANYQRANNDVAGRRFEQCLALPCSSSLEN